MTPNSERNLFNIQNVLRSWTVRLSTSPELTPQMKGVFGWHSGWRRRTAFCEPSSAVSRRSGLFSSSRRRERSGRGCCSSGGTTAPYVWARWESGLECSSLLTSISQDIALEDMVTLSCQPVGHRFCLDCFGDYCIAKISEAQVDARSLVCPSVGCMTPITPHELKAHVSAEIFARFERFTLRSLCEENNWKSCPRCNVWFAEIPTGDDDEEVWREVKCQNPDCQHVFCARCGQEPHIKTKVIPGMGINAPCGNHFHREARWL